MNRILAITASAIAMTIATGVTAQANNNPPPAGSIYSLTGMPQTTAYTNYSVNFIAQSTNTNITFALRNDPTFIALDDVSLTAGSGANLLTNGSFEDGGGSAPTGWTYLNQYGATAGGTVNSGCGRTGNFCYRDGAVQAYDAITQAVTTTVGTAYTLSFWARVEAITGTGSYQPLSTNGASGTGGNGIDLFVYAQDGTPAPGGVPEPATWAMMLLGFGMVAGTARYQRKATKITYA